MQNEDTSIVIVGAGPYGLSLAAHLAEIRVPFRIFGKPMTTWREHMPENMLLKSEGFASSLSAPFSNARLESFCALKNLPYQAIGLPIPLARFVDYAEWFQRQFVPNLEAIDVVAIDKQKDCFSITLSDKRIINAQSVILATGITWLSKIPDILAGLPTQLLSHSFQHRDARPYFGKRVVVVGAGASAIDTASLFAEANARVHILSRQPKIIFHNPPKHRSLAKRIRSPQTGIGPGLRSKFFTSAPLLFRRLPASKRFEIARSFPPPSAGWFMREKINGTLSVIVGRDIQSVRAKQTEVELKLLDRTTGDILSLTTDHVVAATGYDVDLQRIPILSPRLREKIAHHRNCPLLSDNFECSVESLYFVGPVAAPTFGPLMRFVVGAAWAVPRIVRHLSRNPKTT